MSRLFGPRTVLEVTLTVFDDQSIGYQYSSFIGTHGPADVQHLLMVVARQLGREQQESPGPNGGTSRSPLVPPVRQGVVL